MSGFVQCIPGSGKTWLAKRDSRFADSDAILALHGLKGKAGYDALLGDSELKARVVTSLKEAAKNRTVLCNFDPDSLGLPTSRRYSYKPDEYVEHLIVARRFDLLSSFSEEELRSWAEGYKSKDNVIWLMRGQYIMSRI